MFATVKLLAVYLTLGPIAGLLGIPYTLLVGDIGLLYRVGMWIARAGVRASGIEVRVTGLENLPTATACIFLSNHVSNLDPPVLLPSIPGRCSVLLKRELMAIPILGTAMRLAQFVPVERGDRSDRRETEPGLRRESARASVDAAGEVLRAGLHIVVFPEGTRSRDGNLKPFKKGPFYLAKQTGAPVIPVAISGTERMMHKGSVKIAPGIARVQFLPAIDPAKYATREELMGAVHAAIARALPTAMHPREE